MSADHDLSLEDVTLIRRALALMNTVGSSAPTDKSAAAVDCLAAAESLSALAPDSPAPSAPMTATDALIAIEESLRLLAELSPAVFADSAVADAVDALQRAHALASR